MKIIPLIVLTALFACNSTEQPKSDLPESGREEKTAILTGCYSLENDQDTVQLQLSGTTDDLSGSLRYQFFEKDLNTGTFRGATRDSLITGWYLFQSEGMSSVRQVVWKVDQKRLIPGYGPMLQQGDTMRFISVDSLRFDTAQTLVKRPC